MEVLDPEFESSCTWALARDYLAANELNDFVADLRKNDIWKHFEPVSQLITKKEKITGEQWKSLLTKMFSRINSCFKGLENIEPVRRQTEQLVRIFLFEMQVSFSKNPEENQAMMTAAREEALKIHDPEAFNLGPKQVFVNGQSSSNIESGNCIVMTLNTSILHTIKSHTPFWDFLLDIIRSRDLLFESLLNGAICTPIQCFKEKMYAVAAFFHFAQEHNILQVQYNQLTPFLVDDGGRPISRRLEDLIDKGKNSRVKKGAEQFSAVSNYFKVVLQNQ